MQILIGFLYVIEVIVCLLLATVVMLQKPKEGGLGVSFGGGMGEALFGAQMGNVLAIRSSRDSLFQIGVFSNPALVGAVLLTFGLQLAVIYWPPLQRIFQTTALTAGELLLSLAVGSIVFWAVEAQKLYLRRRDTARSV